MQCAFCSQGELHPSATAVVLQEGDTAVIHDNVPTRICNSCDEYLLAEDIAHAALERVREAAARGSEVDILRYAA